MCFLPRHGPLSGADGPRPRTPALIPATESKTFHLAEPGAGDPKQMPSVDIRPHGLKGSQGKLPPKLEGGGMAATHSTKCWHLHPQPGRLLTGSWRVVTAHQTVSWFGMLVIAEDLVRDIKTFFFHCYLFFPLLQFFWCVVQQYNFSLIYSISRYCLYNVQWFHFRK